MSNSSTDTIPYPNHKGVSGIYEIFCFSNGKRYIGSAENLVRRRTNHLSHLRRGVHGNIHLQRAWNLYGEKSFEFRVIEICEPSVLLEREQYFIDTLRPEFNISIFAGSPMKGRKQSEESRESMSQKLKGRPHTEEHRQKISKSKIGKPRSEETKRKLSDFWKGKKLNAEHRNNITKVMRKFFSGENNPIHKHPEKAARGEEVNTAKLTTDDIVKIRQLYADGKSSKELSEMFCVHRSQIQRIVSRKQWKHIS